MLVSLGPLAVSGEIDPEHISVAFDRIDGQPKLQVFYMDDRQTIGRITLSPFEFRKIFHNGVNLLREHKVPE